jgi:hypothetical protein
MNVPRKKNTYFCCDPNVLVPWVSLAFVQVVVKQRDLLLDQGDDREGNGTSQTATTGALVVQTVTTGDKKTMRRNNIDCCRAMSIFDAVHKIHSYRINK